MITIINCKNKNYLFKLRAILESRRSRNKTNTNIVLKIINEIKKNKQKALLKYEKKFSNNQKIKISKKIILNSIKNLDPKVKSAINFAHDRILKFHKNQKF